jgi:hypothetical protein
MVVAAHDSFTNDLHSYAVKHPGAILRASIDGPYGQLPNLSKVADKVILVAGGSGATFTFGVALDMIKKLGDPAKPTIEFIWTVKEEGIYTSPLFHMHDNINFRTEALSWFSKELMELQACPRVTIALHSTRPSCTRSSSSPISPLDEKPSALQLEKSLPSLSQAQNKATFYRVPSLETLRSILPRNVEHLGILQHHWRSCMEDLM